MKKRILIMSFGSDAGGIERSLIEFLRFLESRQKFEISLYLWRKPGILFNQLPISVNILNQRLVPGRITEFKEYRGIFKKFGYVLWYLLFRISTLLNLKTLAFKKMKDRYDIAISYCQNGYSPYYIIDKVQADKKYIWYHHGTYERRGSLKRIDEQYFRKYDNIIAVSNACKIMLEKSFPGLSSKILVIPNLIDRETILRKAELPLKDRDNTAETLKIVTVGRLAPEKGQMLALNAARILHENNISFQWYFVGDGEDFRACQDFISVHHMKEVCFLTGATQNPYSYMKMANIYVQPSLIESECLTIKEAKYLKKLIIATNIPAINEVLEDGKYGILCEPNAESFAHAILNMISDTNIRNSLTSNLSSLKMNNKKQENIIMKILS